MKVQTKVMVGALSLMLVGGAWAQSSGEAELRSIAEASGLQVREVQMLLSNSPSAYTTWYFGYDVSARKLRQAVREGRVHLGRSGDGAVLDFAAWQKVPDRQLSLDAASAVATIDRDSH